jgi:hypothetical protein
MIKLFLSRYFSYSFIALEILLIPILLDKADFGDLEYMKSIITLAPFALLGSFSGFVYFKYNAKRDYYNELFLGGLISCIINAICFAFFWGNIFFIIPFMLNGMSTIVEKRIQTKNGFILSILFKPLLSVFMIIVIFCNTKFFGLKHNLEFVLTAVYLCAFSVWVLLAEYFYKMNVIPRFFRGNRLTVIKYYKLVYKGFFINISTILISLFLFSTRYFIKNYFKTDLASYSLALNISQFVFIGVNTLGYISLIHIGENLSKVSKSYLKTTLYKSAIYFALLFVGGVTIMFGYNFVIRSFHRSVEYYLIATAFIGLFYTTSVLSPILLYKDKLKESTMFLLVCFLIDVGTSFIFVQMHLDALLLAIKSGLLLLITGIYNLYLIFYAIKFEEDDKTV